MLENSNGCSFSLIIQIKIFFPTNPVSSLQMLFQLRIYEERLFTEITVIRLFIQMNTVYVQFHLLFFLKGCFTLITCVSLGTLDFPMNLFDMFFHIMLPPLPKFIHAPSLPRRWFLWKNCRHPLL